MTYRSVVVVVMALAWASGAPAQENQACLLCHGNSALFEGRADAGDLTVAADAYDRSAHGRAGLTCGSCHQGLAFPHGDAPPPPIQCSTCHTTQASQHNRSLHGQAAARGDELAPSCADCHGVHDVLSHTDQRSPTYVMNIPFLCGECHREGAPVARTRNIPQERILENYSMSMHGAGLLRAGLTVTAVCTSCHTSHEILPHTDPRSSINRDNVATTCTRCHAQIEQVHVQFIEGRLWETEPNKIPSCIDCHAPHVIRRVVYEAGAANANCLRCHSDPGLTMEREGQVISLFLDEQAYNSTSHSGTACAQCHTEVTASLQASRACETVVSPVDCGICHAQQVTDYGTSLHGRVAAEGDPDAPTCQDCHDKHAEMDNAIPTSPTFARNVPELCARCHREGEVAAVRIEAAVPDIVRSYQMSIHGKGLLESGLTVTATCTSCHTTHGELPPDDPGSSVNRANVASTCGNCHHGIEEEFRVSIHSEDYWENGDGELEADRELPSCEDCHTSHTISRTDQSGFRFLMMDQCGRCHLDESETFFDTFHGKVSRLGEAGAAKCYDCHGTHNILPVTETASLLSRQNIVETCSSCHARANLRFTGYLTHATHHDPGKYPFLFWAFWGMTTLLVGTLTFALAHTGAWLFRLWRTPELWKHRHTVAPGEKVYRRFTTFERSLHFTMLVSFFVLALTGMALKFSYMGWAQLFARVLGGFPTTGFLHRLAAVILIAVFLVHLWDVWKRKKASDLRWWDFIFSKTSLMFNRQDLREFWASIRWFMGKGERPRYGRFSYWEKFDYFAVFWGMFVIGSTGLVLWFPEIFTWVMPGQAINIATIIHSDEALLAVGFIFTVHFFNTHFRLDKFPMDPVIFTGRVPLEEFKVDKPQDYQDLVAEGKLDEYLVHPYPKRVERAFQIFGFIALGIGLTLIALIVYAMLFGYR